MPFVPPGECRSPSLLSRVRPAAPVAPVSTDPASRPTIRCNRATSAGPHRSPPAATACGMTACTRARARVHHPGSDQHQTLGFCGTSRTRSAPPTTGRSRRSRRVHPAQRFSTQRVHPRRSSRTRSVDPRLFALRLATSPRSHKLAAPGPRPRTGHASDGVRLSVCGVRTAAPALTRPRQPPAPARRCPRTRRRDVRARAPRVRPTRKESGSGTPRNLSLRY